MADILLLNDMSRATFNKIDELISLYFTFPVMNGIAEQPFFLNSSLKSTNEAQ